LHTSDHGCSDYVVSSYTPSIEALLKAQEGSLTTSKADARALLIDEAVAPGLPRLYGVGEEMKVIERSLGKTGVEYSRIAHVTDGATRDKVANRLLDATIVHFACHGQENSMEPLQSGFKLRDKTLTIEDLMKLDMPKAIFAFLSACETAKGNQERPDFNVHLSAAMLFVGFKSIIGTLW
jgi:CHAT domain-containing protein